MDTNNFLDDVASLMSKQLESFSGYQDQQKEIYDGRRAPLSLGISLSPELDAKIRTKLSWGTVSVDYLSNQLNFDILLNDEWGINELFNYGQADNAINSAIKNSIIASCSFVSVTPGNTSVGEPPVVYTVYSGSEATGIFNNRTGKLDFGLAIEKMENDKVVSWLVFAPDATYRWDGENFTKINDSKYGCQLVLFAYCQDIATKPFGVSRNDSAQREAIDSAIRVLKRLEISSEFYATPQRYLFTNGEEGLSNLESLNSKIGQILHLNNGESETDSPTFGSIDAASPEPFIDAFNLYAQQFAAAALMDPQEFGISPANGSLSSDAEDRRAKKMVDLTNRVKKIYDFSVKQLAFHSASIVGIPITGDMFKLSATWVNSIGSVSDIGKIGDALGKLFESVPELAKTDIAYELLGISKRGRLDNIDAIKVDPMAEFNGFSDELKQIIMENAKAQIDEFKDLDGPNV